MNTIKGYIILNKNTNYYIKLFIYLSIIFLLFIVILLNTKYKMYYKTKGIVTSDKNLMLIVKIDKLKYVKNNNKLVIDNKEYVYSIKSINNDYEIDNNLNNYLYLYLDVSLDSKDKITNNVLNVKLLESNKKIFYYLKNYIMKCDRNE